MLKVPDEIDLLDFFGSEPIESTPHEGYYHSDKGKNKLQAQGLK